MGVRCSFSAFRWACGIRESISVTEADFAKNWLAHAHAHMTDGGALAEQMLVGKFYDAMKRKADSSQDGLAHHDARILCEAYVHAILPIMAPTMGPAVPGAAANAASSCEIEGTSSEEPVSVAAPRASRRSPTPRVPWSRRSIGWSASCRFLRSSQEGDSSQEGLPISTDLGQTLGAWQEGTSLCVGSRVIVHAPFDAQGGGYLACSPGGRVGSRPHG